jgi:hypothetical protein
VHSEGSISESISAFDGNYVRFGQVTELLAHERPQCAFDDVMDLVNGQEIGVSSWIRVDQQRINEFAHGTRRSIRQRARLALSL